MVTIQPRSKPLSVNPLKASAPLGAALALLGLERTMPLFHSSQGCTAFAKVFLVRHFREPIPLQTTAMDQIATVMGADENIVEAIDHIVAKQSPAVIALLTTGLSETQGADVHRVIREYKLSNPECPARLLVIHTPDFSGCLESGYAAALEAMIEQWLPEQVAPRTANPHRINVLASATLTPGDVEELKEIIESFGLTPIMVPDLSQSLDGHLPDDDYNPLSAGGLTLDHFDRLGEAAATLVIGSSLNRAADLLKARTGVVNYRFEHLLDINAMDELLMTLTELSGNTVPKRLERQRRQLQDAMLDTHFVIGLSRIAVAADPEHLVGLTRLIAMMGGETVSAVTTTASPLLQNAICETVQIGDLDELERLATENNADLLLGNAHLVQSAERLGLPLLRCGFPQWDQIGGFSRTWIGYRGMRQALFDLANLMVHHRHHGVKPYHSIYRQPESKMTKEHHHAGTPSASGF